MTKIILKALLWGAISWLVLSVLLFFGIGFYQGLIDSDSEISSAVQIALRLAVLFISLGITAFLFIKEEKKLKPFRRIVAEEEPKPKAPPPVEKETKPEFHGVVMPKIKETPPPPRPVVLPPPPPKPELPKPPVPPPSSKPEPVKITPEVPKVIYPEKPKMEEGSDKQRTEIEQMAKELADNLNKNVSKASGSQPPAPSQQTPQPPPWNRP